MADVLSMTVCVAVKCSNGSDNSCSWNLLRSTGIVKTVDANDIGVKYSTN